MAHRYGDAILVRRASDPPGASSRGGRVAHSAGAGATDAPTAFAWRGVWYQVDEILATWRLRDRWWAGGVGAPIADVAEVVEDTTTGAPGNVPAGAYSADALPPTERPTERVYFRALCRDPEGMQVFDLYYDVASSQWVLDRAHD